MENVVSMETRSTERRQVTNLVMGDTMYSKAHFPVEGKTDKNTKSQGQFNWEYERKGFIVKDLINIK